MQFFQGTLLNSNLAQITAAYTVVVVTQYVPTCRKS